MNKPIEQEWLAPKNARLPDFIICGAMKCGTSTLHTILNKHPDIYIPSPEIHFFDIDDIFQHSDFFLYEDKCWRWPNISEAPQDYWNWYQNFFKNAPENCLLGEDSTCYLPSSKAAHRISLQSKQIKAIICLRQPTLRAYSQYWHMLRNGRAMFCFEDTIKFTPHYVLARSMYLDQIINFMRHIPRERIFFFVLEEFMSDRERIIKELSGFLSINYDNFPDGVLNNTHSNKATIPKSSKLQAFKNRLMRSSGNTRYSGRLPLSVRSINKNSPFALAMDIFYKKINPLIRTSTPKMNPATQKFLNQYFQQKLEGLSGIVGIDLEK